MNMENQDEPLKDLIKKASAAVARLTKYFDEMDRGKDPEKYDRLIKEATEDLEAFERKVKAILKEL